MRDDLLLYYERELDYLRKMAAEFAEENPKIASRLAIGPAQVEDPFVERLLEAFAFLAARVHLKIDDEFPEISEALLSVVYPHLIQPIPSMSLVEFQLDPEKGKLSTGLLIPRNTVLRSRPVGGVPCTFRTCYDTTLWPLTVTAAEWKTPSRLQPPLKAVDAAAAIRVELRCAPDALLPALKLDPLRFYLHGESGVIHALYELLCSRLTRIVVRDLSPGSKAAPVSLPASSLRPVGFEADEGMLPYTRRSFIGHRLLQEFFIFPEKFFFVDITGLAEVWDAGFKDAAELIFLFSEVEGENRRERLEVEITPKIFRLGCAPIVNLFPQTAEPVQLTQRKYEYPIVPDVRRPDSTEVFSVDQVTGMNTRTQETVNFEPFYSFRHTARPVKGQSFWLARRRPSGREGSDATDIYLSLVDLSMRAADPDADILTIRTTCTNRDLPSRLPFGSEDADFECDGIAALKRIVTLKKPTPPVRPPVGKAALWRLISHLSLNYLSLVEEGREALQQILKIYDFTNSAYSENIIEGITGLKSLPRFAGVLSENGVAFARGTRVEMELDEDQFVGGGVYLFASVIEQFLGLYASLNSFSQLAVRTRQRRGVLREWPPRAGRRILL
ncbi:MAG TPA: type VI secretion system baseplate subunit TssF [Terriglobia bacterium]|nr:type VI secretion system baseplate subunit TssF [Terriglobia bacterium]